MLFKVNNKVSGRLPVLAALIGNSLVMLAKLVGFLITGSGAFFSEAVHSFADTANQSLLLIGVRRSRKKATAEYPYGFGRERYVWALISACGIFFVGAGVTIYHGFSQLLIANEVHFSPWAIIILLFSLVVESITLWFAYYELRQRFPKTDWSEILKRADPTTLAIVYEDSLAVLGVLIALSSFLLTYFTGQIYYDSLGSLLIGALLGIAAVMLINKNRHFLIMTAIPEEIATTVQEILATDPAIEKVYDFKSAVLDVDKYLIKCDVEFNASALLKELNKYHFIANEYEAVQGNPEEFKKFCVDYLDRVPRLVGRRIDEIEKKIRKQFPQIIFIDIEIN